jgi:hypothetical protein
MAWPPAVLPINRTDATLQQTNHPADHNAVNLAVNDTVAKIQSLGDPWRAANGVSASIVGGTLPTAAAPVGLSGVSGTLATYVNQSGIDMLQFNRAALVSGIFRVVLGGPPGNTVLYFTIVLAGIGTTDYAIPLVGGFGATLPIPFHAQVAAGWKLYLMMGGAGFTLPLSGGQVNLGESGTLGATP